MSTAERTTSAPHPVRPHTPGGGTDFAAELQAFGDAQARANGFNPPGAPADAGEVAPNDEHALAYCASMADVLERDGESESARQVRALLHRVRALAARAREAEGLRERVETAMAERIFARVLDRNDGDVDSADPADWIIAAVEMQDERGDDAAGRDQERYESAERERDLLAETARRLTEEMDVVRGELETSEREAAANWQKYWDVFNPLTTSSGYTPAGALASLGREHIKRMMQPEEQPVYGPRAAFVIAIQKGVEIMDALAVGAAETGGGA